MTESPVKSEAESEPNIAVVATCGGIASIVASIPLAGITALCFRFPVPLGGIGSGPEVVAPAMFGAIYYLVVEGGAFPQALAGILGGVLSQEFAKSSGGKTIKMAVLLGAASALPGVLLLAVLDWIIGPW